MKQQLKRYISLILFLFLTVSIAGCGISPEYLVPSPTVTPVSELKQPTAIPTPAEEQNSDAAIGTETPTPEPSIAIEEDGWYYSAQEVGLFLYTYGRLPDNFISKEDAKELGWTGGSVEKFQPGYAIGGSKFGNREGLLPKADGRQYYECDIDTNGGKSRGAKRIVYSNDGLIYYTEDHYDSFTLLYGEE